MQSILITLLKIQPLIMIGTIQCTTIKIFQQIATPATYPTPFGRSLLQDLPITLIVNFVL